MTDSGGSGTQTKAISELKSLVDSLRMRRGTGGGESYMNEQGECEGWIGWARLWKHTEEGSCSLGTGQGQWE